MAEAKVEDELLENWIAMMNAIVVLQEKWEKHLVNVHNMNIDYVHPKLQGHLAHGFNRAEFYLGIPELLEYARSQGGIEYLQIGKGETKVWQKTRK